MDVFFQAAKSPAGSPGGALLRGLVGWSVRQNERVVIWNPPQNSAVVTELQADGAVAKTQPEDEREQRQQTVTGVLGSNPRNFRNLYDSIA
jgi:hypothetical protein